MIEYKPQVTRSEAGFISAIIVKDGNVSDSKEFIPVIKASVKRTGIIPESVIVDDGYAAIKNITEAKKMKIKE